MIYSWQSNRIGTRDVKPSGKAAEFPQLVQQRWIGGNILLRISLRQRGKYCAIEYFDIRCCILYLPFIYNLYSIIHNSFHSNCFSSAKTNDANR